MSEPVVSPDRKPPETIKITARYLETVLDQAHSAANASAYLDVDDSGALVRVEPDDAVAEAVTRADEQLTQYLRENRAVLSEDQHWRSYYNEFDRADARAREQTMSDDRPNPLPGNESSDENARRLAAHVRARDLEAKIADLVDEAPGPGDLDEAYKEMWVAGYEEELDQHLRANRHLLGDAPYWRSTYDGIDRYDRATAASAPRESQSATSAPLAPPNSAPVSSGQFAFGAAAPARTTAPAVASRRIR